MYDHDAFPAMVSKFHNLFSMTTCCTGRIIELLMSKEFRASRFRNVISFLYASDFVPLWFRQRYKFFRKSLFPKSAGSQCECISGEKNNRWINYNQACGVLWDTCGSAAKRRALLI